MKAEIASLFRKQVKKTVLALGLPLLVLLLVGVGLLLASQNYTDLTPDGRILMKYLGVFLTIVSLGMFAYILWWRGTQNQRIRSLEADEATLTRIHFEVIGKKGSHKWFRVTLYVSQKPIAVKLPEATFLSMQAYFVEAHPDITPTTLLRKLGAQEAPQATAK